MSVAILGFSESIWTRPTARGPSGHSTRSILSSSTAGPGARAPPGPRTHSTVGYWAPSSAAPSPSFCLVQQHKREDQKGPKQSSHHRLDPASLDFQCWGHRVFDSAAKSITWLTFKRNIESPGRTTIKRTFMDGGTSLQSTIDSNSWYFRAAYMEFLDWNIPC